MSEVIPFVDKRDAQLLSASIGEAVAEIEIGGMANGFAVSRTGVERAPPNLRCDRNFFGVEILDKGVDGALRALGTEAEAREFMTTPHPELEGRSPIDAAKTDLGARRAEQILNALEYGLAL